MKQQAKNSSNGQNPQIGRPIRSVTFVPVFKRNKARTSQIGAPPDAQTAQNLSDMLRVAFMKVALIPESGKMESHFLCLENHSL